MKTIYTRLIIYFIAMLPSVSLMAQPGACKFEEGSFELWTDFTASITNLLDENSLILPVNTFPILRISEIALIPNFLEDLVESGATDEEIQLSVFGMGRSEDASHGEFSVRMQANEASHVTDMFIFGECGSIPDAMRVDIKKSGKTSDTLVAVIYVYNTTFIPIDSEGEIDYANISAFAEAATIVDEEFSEFVTFELEMDVGNTNISPDSVVMQMAIYSGTETKDGSYPSYTIDNVRFTGGATSADELDLEGTVSVYPTITKDFLTVESDRNIEQARIFSIDGKQGHFQKINGRNANIDVGNLVPGEYFIQFHLDNKVTSRKFVKM